MMNDNIAAESPAAPAMTDTIALDRDPTEARPAKHLCVIGGGAAGCFAAIRAAECGADVTVFEKNRSVGRKLRITGKGRCNVTNDCDVREMMTAIASNPRFLYGALARFSPADAIA